MGIRLFEYGFYLAKREAVVEDGLMTIRIPNQAVIFIEENGNVRDQRMRIIFPNGEETIYSVETLRFWEYSLLELREKKMYNLLPLVIFKHRKILQSIVDKKPKLDEEKRQLLADLNEVGKEVKALIVSHELEGEDVHKIALAMTNITEYLNNKYIKDDFLGEEVVSMTKTLYDPIVEQRGERKRAIEIAKALLDVLDDTTIAIKTGSSYEEVQKLRQEVKG